MREGWIPGLQASCFGILIISTVCLFPNRRRDPSLDALLCATVLLLCAIVQGFFIITVFSLAPGLLHQISNAAMVLVGIAAMVSMGGFLRLWKPEGGHGNRLVILLTALVPLIFFLPACLFTEEAALFPIAETFSLLILFAFYIRGWDADLRARAEEVENHQAMVFQWQMHPHFLFNTLHTIRELTDRDPALAGAGIDNLAGYLRKNLDALTSNRMIPFSQELAHIEQYVMLEKMNPANQFEVVYDLQIIDFYLPALSVQPLVENAIRHGVRSLGRDGLVFVTTERHGEMIRIIVEDNGPGFPDDSTHQQKEHASQGLANVRRRLETQCGGSLHIRSEPTRTRLIVLLPKKG